MTLIAVIVACGRIHHMRMRRAKAVESIKAAGGLFTFRERIDTDGAAPVICSQVPVRLSIHVAVDPMGNRMGLIDSDVVQEVRLLNSLQRISLVGRSPFPLQGRQYHVNRGTLARELLRLCDVVSKLDSLELAGLPIDDECLRAISSIDDLRILSLQNTLITDEGLKYLSNCQLRWLNISGNYITSKGLKNLGSQEDLEVLIANNTCVHKKTARNYFPQTVVFCDKRMPWNLLNVKTKEVNSQWE